MTMPAPRGEAAGMSASEQQKWLESKREQALAADRALVGLGGAAVAKAEQGRGSTAVAELSPAAPAAQAVAKAAGQEEQVAQAAVAERADEPAAGKASAASPFDSQPRWGQKPTWGPKPTKS